MKTVALFTATGAAMTIVLGMRPDFVKIRNLTDATIPQIEWDRAMLLIAGQAAGVKTVLNTTTPVVTLLAATNGIGLYNEKDMEQVAGVVNPNAAAIVQATVDANVIMPVYMDRLAAPSAMRQGDIPLFETVPVGTVLGSGITLAADGAVNLAGKLCLIEFGEWDSV